MATPLGTTFSTDEEVVAQGDVTFTGKMVKSLVMEFDQAKYEEFLSSGFKSPRVAQQYCRIFSETAPKSFRRLLQRWLAQTEPFLVTSRVWPESTSPMRPAKPTSSKTNLATPLL